MCKYLISFFVFKKSITFKYLSNKGYGPNFELLGRVKFEEISAWRAPSYK